MKPTARSFSSLHSLYLMVNIQTLGYGGKKPTEFFQELKAIDPDIIVDVRKNPDKAFLGCYTRPKLSEKLGEIYTWIPELGNKSRKMPPTLIDEEEGIRKLLKLAKHKERFVLLCSEKLEERCHRSYVKARFLESLNDLDLD